MVGFKWVEILLVLQLVFQIVLAEVKSNVDIFDVKFESLAKRDSPPVDPDDEPVGPKVRKVMPPAAIAWVVVPERNMFDGFPPLPHHENTTLDKELGRQGLGALIGGLTAVTGALGAVNGVFGGAISNLRGLASLIREGVELAELFGFGKKENAILVDNRCTSCNLTVRCISADKDTGPFEVNFPDGYILKFTTFLPNDLPGNFGFTNWQCEYRDLNTGRRVRNDAYGGGSPRQLFNLFEVRDRGVWHMDMETGRIDARQPVAFW